MNNNLCYKIKALREQNNLTQSELATLFSLDSATINEYESNSNSVPFLFIQNLCKHFNLPLSYFEESDERVESKSENLISALKNGKLAIFDTEQSIFLCPHKYDNIVLSDSKFQLGIICKDKEIIHNDIITNSGEIINVDDDLVIGYRNGFNRYGIAIAYKKSTNTAVLINHKGKELTKEYRVINIRSDFDFLPSYFVAKINIEEEIIDYYTSTLQKIDFSYSSIDELCSRIERYGCVMLNNLDSSYLRSPETYVKILMAVDKYILDNIEKVEEEHKQILKEQISIALSFLEKNVFYCSRIIPISFPYHYKAVKREYITNKLERNFIYKRENELLKKILD